MKKVGKKIRNILGKIAFKRRVKKVDKWAVAHPMLSFFAVLAILLALIATSNFLTAPEAKEEKNAPVKKVGVFSVGSVPYRSFQARVEKSNTITVYAQSGGIVNNIGVVEGDAVGRGKTLVSLASNYYGGNSASIQRQIADKQYSQTKQTYDWQREAIGKQREIALQTDANADELRQITARSISETQDLINLYETMLVGLNSQLEATSSPSTVLQGNKISAQQALQGLKSSLRNSEYQANENNPPAQLADAQRELALRQLDIQEKSLEFGLEISSLQLKLAQVNEAVMYPASPFAGVVDRVFVKKGQMVNPGTALVSLSATAKTTKIVALVPRGVAQNISGLDLSVIEWIGGSVEMQPAHISGDAVESGLFAVTFVLDGELVNSPAEGEYVTVRMPVGQMDSLGSVVFLPLTAVYQTENSAYVMVVDENGEVVVAQIELGRVDGAFVRVEKGLANGDQVVADRSVKAGEKVEIVW